jgi:hypothetical protein
LIENEGDVHGPEDLAIEIYNSFPPTRAQTGSVLRAAHALAREQPGKIAVNQRQGSRFSLDRRTARDRRASPLGMLKPGRSK